MSAIEEKKTKPPDKALHFKKCDAVWNRDVNSSTNIYRIAKNAINGLERPRYLCREKKDENIKVEKPKKSFKRKPKNLLRLSPQQTHNLYNMQ